MSTVAMMKEIETRHRVRDESPTMKAALIMKVLTTKRMKSSTYIMRIE